MEKRAKEILDRLKCGGADYADIRIYLTDQSENLSTLNGTLENCSSASHRGYGIRVLYQGAWGFASAEDFSIMPACAEGALDKAKAASTFIRSKVELAPKKVVQDSFKTPCQLDPFNVSLEEKVSFLLSLDQRLKHDKIAYSGISVNFHKRLVLYVDTEGTVIEKEIIDVFGKLRAFTNDADGLQQRRTFTLFLDQNGTTGWESILDPTRFSGQCERIRDELLQLLDAPVCEEQTCDIILQPEMMALQTHETIGHALELDRILGYELSFAGGSHVDLDYFGQFQFGSSKLTAFADGAVPNSPGANGYDDDGVKMRSVTMIENGILENAITSRQMIMEANKRGGREIFTESGGCCRAAGYNKVPLERMNNINVAAGQDGTLEDIIKATENGLLLETPKSWSIGSNRENFHFAVEAAWQIKDGEISHMVRNATYSGPSIPFWHSLDMVGDESTWQLQLVDNCGKGQPNQIMRLGHGVPVCRFKDIQVGL